MNFLVFCILVNAILAAVVFFFFMKATAKSAAQNWGLDFYDMSILVLTVSFVVASIMFWDDFDKFSNKIFNTEEPVCIEYLGAFPVKSHWSKPNRTFIETPDNMERFQVTFKLGSSTSVVKIKPESKIFLDYVDDMYRVKATSDSLHMYVYHYKKWGPFEMPNYLRSGIISKNVPDFYEEGKCVEIVKLK